MKELDQVVLTVDLPKERLAAGDVGVIVHEYSDGQAFEVEFFGVDGHTIAVATVETSQVRPVTERDVSHARPVRTSAQGGRRSERVVTPIHRRAAHDEGA